MTISFKVIGQPQSKARPRFANGHIYTPKGTKVYEADVKKAYLAVAQGYYFKDGPVSLVITAYLKRAKSNRRKFATTKPDIDNILKAVLDGLNGVAFDDDKQVANISAHKLYCNNADDIPYIIVKLDNFNFKEESK